MTAVSDLILAELSGGPKSLAYLDRKCAPKPIHPWDHKCDIEKVVRMMIKNGTVRETGCQYEDGIFAPVYEAIRCRADFRTGNSARSPTRSIMTASAVRISPRWTRTR